MSKSVAFMFSVEIHRAGQKSRTHPGERHYWLDEKRITLMQQAGNEEDKESLSPSVSAVNERLSEDSPSH